MKYKCKKTKHSGVRLLPRQANLLRTHFHTRAGAVKCESSKKEKNCKEVAHPDILPAYQTDFNPILGPFDTADNLTPRTI